MDTTKKGRTNNSIRVKTEPKLKLCHIFIEKMLEGTMSHAKKIAEAVRASVDFAVLSNSFADDADDVDAVGRVTSS